MLNRFGGHDERAAYPAGQTLGQTASFRQTAPETWCQSRVCGAFLPSAPKTVKHRLPPELLPNPRVRSVGDSVIHMRSSLFAICLAVTAAASDRALNPTFESAAPLSAQSPIDARVFDRLKRLDVPPANLSSDAVFLRRAFLDVIGTLPTPLEASDFLADPAPGKRAALID